MPPYSAQLELLPELPPTAATAHLPSVLTFLEFETLMLDFIYVDDDEEQACNPNYNPRVIVRITVTVSIRTRVKLDSYTSQMLFSDGRKMTRSIFCQALTEPF